MRARICRRKAKLQWSVAEVAILCDPLQRFLRAELRDRIGGALAYRPEPVKPLAIAGLWRAWAEPEGTAFSFTTLTINSDEHPLMRRFHKPGAEKRVESPAVPSNPAA